MDLIKRDYIYSALLNENIAEISITKNKQSDFFYNGEFLISNFPAKLISLIDDYWDCVDSFALSLLDEIVEEIMLYQLKLVRNDKKIFQLELKNNCTAVTFFTKNPTSEGFMDDYPT